VCVCVCLCVCERESDRKEVKDRTSLIQRMIERLQIEEAEKYITHKKVRENTQKFTEQEERERERERERESGRERQRQRQNKKRRN
jgi:hypothetical protein